MLKQQRNFTPVSNSFLNLTQKAYALQNIFLKFIITAVETYFSLYTPALLIKSKSSLRQIFKRVFSQAMPSGVKRSG